MPRVHSSSSKVGKNNSDSESDKESETKMEEDLSPKFFFGGGEVTLSSLNVELQRDSKSLRVFDGFCLYKDW